LKNIKKYFVVFTKFFPIYYYLSFIYKILALIGFRRTLELYYMNNEFIYIIYKYKGEFPRRVARRSWIDVFVVPSLYDIYVAYHISMSSYLWALVILLCGCERENTTKNKYMCHVVGINNNMCYK